MKGETMNDLEAVVAECQQARGDHEISDACARAIGSMYQDGQGSLTYAFASTGAITTDPERLWGLFFPDYSAMSSEERLAADMLGTYLESREDHSPVPGWSNLWVR